MPTPTEVEAMAEALAEEVAADGREGTIIVRPDDVAFTTIRRKAGTCWPSHVRALILPVWRAPKA